MKILLTGGSGFLGSALAKALPGEGHHVCLLLRQSSKLNRLRDVEHLLTVKRYRDSFEILEAIRQFSPEAVIHAACAYGREDDSDLEIWSSNFKFGVIILQSLFKLRATPLFINVNTWWPENMGAYAQSKHKFSNWGCKYSTRLGITFLDVILYHLFGPGDSEHKFVSKVISSCLREVDGLKLTTGVQSRDFIFVDDVVSAFCCILKSSNKIVGSSQVEVGSGITTTVRDFAETVKKLTQSRIELLFGQVPYNINEPLISRADISKMVELGWRPTIDLQSGIRKILALESARWKLLR